MRCVGRDNGRVCAKHYGLDITLHNTISGATYSLQPALKGLHVIGFPAALDDDAAAAAVLALLL